MIRMVRVGPAENLLKTCARQFGPDDEAVRQIRRDAGIRRLAIHVEQGAQAGSDGRLMRDHEEVAGLVEALAGEVQRRDQCRTIVGHDVLGVVFGLGAGVAVHLGAHAVQKDLQVLESLVPVLGVLGEQRTHPHFAIHGVRQRVEDLEIVTAEDGKHEFAARAANHVQDGIAALAGLPHESFGGRLGTWLERGRHWPERRTIRVNAASIACMDSGARAHGMCGARRHMRGMIFELCPGAIDAMSLFPALARRRQTNRRMRDLVQSREDKRGLLIAFEGPDGSGKTTQRKLFKNWLKSEGHDVVTTKWNSSALVKPLVKARKAAHALSPEEFSLLHAADFRYRLETDVLPALWKGQTVVADRYLFTALARDAARGLDLHWLMELYRPLFWPDIVFYFSVSPETSGKRIAAERSPQLLRGRPGCHRNRRPAEQLHDVHRARDSGVRSAGQGIPVCDGGCRAIDLRSAPPDSRRCTPMERGARGRIGIRKCWWSG